MAHETLLSVYGDLNGKEIEKRGGIFIHVANSLCSTVDTSATL